MRLSEKEPSFIKAQPFLWPLVAHVIAMSLVIWNPLLFFWLTRKQKKLRLGMHHPRVPSAFPVV